MVGLSFMSYSLSLLPIFKGQIEFFYSKFIRIYTLFQHLSEGEQCPDTKYKKMYYLFILISSKHQMKLHINYHESEPQD